MWRSILLGKLAIAIVASLITGAICVSIPSRLPDQTWQQNIAWWATGSFFFTLAIALLTAVFLLLRRRR